MLTAAALLKGLSFRGFAVHVGSEEVLGTVTRCDKFPTRDFSAIFVVLSGVSGVNVRKITRRLRGRNFTGRDVSACLKLFHRVAGSIRNIHCVGRGLSSILRTNVTRSLRAVVGAMRSMGATSFGVSFSPALMHKVSCCANPVFRVSVSRFNKDINKNKHCSRVVNGFAKGGAYTYNFSVKFREVIVLLLRENCRVPAGGNGGTCLVRGGVPTSGLLGVLGRTARREDTNARVGVSVVGGGGGFRGSRLTTSNCARCMRFFGES